MTTQPQDHQSSAFTYTLTSGKTVTLPKFQKAMTFGRARRLRKLDEADQLFTLIEEVCNEDTLAALDEMDDTETSRLLEAWQKDSGATLGESSGSSV